MGRKRTSRSLEVLATIEKYIDKYGFAPTYREIADATGIASVSQVSKHLIQLKVDGYIDYSAGYPRTIRVRKSVESANQSNVPESVDDCIALVSAALIGCRDISRGVDVLPYLDKILLQWPDNGPQFTVSVEKSFVRASVVGTGKVFL